MSRDLIGTINTTSILLQDLVKNPAISDINMLTLLWNMARAPQKNDPRIDIEHILIQREPVWSLSNRCGSGPVLSERLNLQIPEQ